MKVEKQSKVTIILENKQDIDMLMFALARSKFEIDENRGGFRDIIHGTSIASCATVHGESVTVSIKDFQDFCDTLMVSL